MRPLLCTTLVQGVPKKMDLLYLLYISGTKGPISKPFFFTLKAEIHMRRFPEPQHFFAAGWQNWDFRPSRKGPRWILLIIILVYIKNLALVAPGFEGSKSQKIILKGLRTLRTWGLAKNTFTLGGSRTLQEGPLSNLSKYSEGMVHLLLLLPKQL